MDKESIRSLTEEISDNIKKNPVEKSRVTFDEIGNIGPGSEVFNAETFETLVSENGANRLIQHMNEPVTGNAFRRFILKIVKKTTMPVFRVFFEEQERHNVRTETLIRMLYARVGDLEGENAELRKKLSDQENGREENK